MLGAKREFALVLTKRKQSLLKGELSKGIFNAGIDWALAYLDSDLKVYLDQGVSINHLAFADDIVLFTKTAVEAQSQIDRLADHLLKCGLIITAGQEGKSASLE